MESIRQCVCVCVRVCVTEGRVGNGLFPDCSLRMFLLLLFCSKKHEDGQAKWKSLLRNFSGKETHQKPVFCEIEDLHTCADEINLI